MSEFYRFTASANVDEARLEIFDVIGLWGVQAADFRAGLNKVTAKTLNVEINSPGGDVFTALAIYNMLKASGKTVVVKVLGVAASAASIIAMAGSKRIMPANTLMMIHNPQTTTAGNAADHHASASTLEKIGQSMVAIYATQTGLPDAEIQKMLGVDTWMSADEALALGFATQVGENVPLRALSPTARAKLPTAIAAAFGTATHSSTTPAGTAPTTAGIWAAHNRGSK